MAHQNQPLGELYSKLSIEDETNNGLVIGAEDVRQAPVEYPLVGKFLTEKNINFNAMQNVMASLWRPKQGLEIHDVGNQRYVFIFYHIMDVKKVLEGGPWSFEQSLLVFRRFSEEEDPLLVPLEESEIWVQVYDMPKGFASQNVLKSVGNYVGQFVKTDPNNFDGNWKSFFRIRVNIKVDKPLKRRMQIKREGGNWSWINFKYERLSNFCFVCGILGHSDKDCDVVYAHPEKEVEKAYGSWLRAPVRNAKMNAGAKWLRNPAMDRSTSTGYGGVSKFRSEVVTRADVGAKFVEVDGMIREKTGGQIGIKIIGREQGDMEGFENEKNEAGTKITDEMRVVMDPKRRRLDEKLGHGTGLNNMETDGLSNMITDGLDNSTKNGEVDPKNLFAAGSVEQARLAQ